MDVTVKEVDGSREITVTARGGSVFVEGRGFAYEFDESIFVHAIRRAITFRGHQEAALLYPPRPLRELVAPA